MSDGRAMAAIPNLDLLKQVLLAPRATDCATCDMEVEAKRRRDAFEARHGAAALMQLKGKQPNCEKGKHMWAVVGDAFACVLCAKVKK